MCNLNDMSLVEECDPRKKTQRLLVVFLQKKSSLLSARIHFCQNPSRQNEMYVSSEFTQHKYVHLTPAGADEHPLAGDRVGDGSVVVDEGGVEGHTVHVQGH